MAISMNFTDFVVWLEEIGIREVLLPFVLIFAIVYAVLAKVNILGKKKSIHVTVALSMALIVVAVHVIGMLPPERDAVIVINNMMPQVSILLVAILTFLFLVGIFGGGVTEHQPGVFSFIIIFAILFNVFFNEAYPALAPLVLWVTLVIAIVAVFKKKEKKTEGLLSGWILVIVFLILFWMIVGSMGLKEIPGWLMWITSPFSQMIAISALIMIIIIAYVTSRSSS